VLCGIVNGTRTVQAKRRISEALDPEKIIPSTHEDEIDAT
jgi:hypothetical protein